MGYTMEIIGPPVSHQQHNFCTFHGSCHSRGHQKWTHTIFNVTLKFVTSNSYHMLSYLSFLLKPTKKTKKQLQLFACLLFSWILPKGPSERSPTVHHRRLLRQACYVVNSWKNVECGNVWYVWLPIVEHNVQRFGVGLVAVFFQTWWEYTGKMMMKTNSRWWQLKYFWNFHPEPWGNDPIWLIVLFKLVETTN